MDFAFVALQLQFVEILLLTIRETCKENYSVLKKLDSFSYFLPNRIRLFDIL